MRNFMGFSGALTILVIGWYILDTAEAILKAAAV